MVLYLTCSLKPDKFFIPPRTNVNWDKIWLSNKEVRMTLQNTVCLQTIWESLELPGNAGMVPGLHTQLL